MAIPTVLKIGGSLLTQSDWNLRLRDWLQKQPAGLYLTIVGGGEVVEAMRELDRIHTLDQSAMHCRCIDLLDATFEVAAELLERVSPNLRTVRSYASLCSIVTSVENSTPDRAEIVLVSVQSFYVKSRCDPALGALDLIKDLMPEIGWQTTSDTLAMFLAGVVQSNRCVLFKSCNVESLVTLDDAVSAGVVDAQVLKYSARGIRCELVKL